MTRNNNPAIVWGVVAVVAVTMICATVVLVLSPERDVGPLIGVLAPTIAALGALAQVSRISGKVENVEHHVEGLSNGLMDAKIRASVADVIPDDHLDNEYVRRQLAADRMRRKLGPAGIPPSLPDDEASDL